MNRGQQSSRTISVPLTVGLGLSGAYFIINGFLWTIPSLLADIWMVISGIFMVIGIYRVIRRFCR